MKNEERIFELLSKNLKHQDRQEEILNQHTQILKELAQGQQKLIDQFHRMNDHLLTRQEKMEDRISRLENKVFRV